MIDWKDTEYFHWIGRGAGKIIEIQETKHKVFFSEEGEMLVGRESFEKNASPIPVDGFKMIEGFHKEELQRTMKNLDPKIVDWIAKDILSKDQNKISPNDIYTPLKKYFSSEEWKRWRNKYAKVIKQHPNLGMPEGKGMNVCYQYFSDGAPKRESKEFNSLNSFKDNWDWFVKFSNIKDDSNISMENVILYFQNNLESLDYVIRIRSLIALEYLKKDISNNLPKLFENHEKLFDIENWKFLRLLKGDEKDKCIIYFSNNLNSNSVKILLSAFFSPFFNIETKKQALNKNTYRFKILSILAKSLKDDLSNRLAGEMKNIPHNIKDQVLKAIEELFTIYPLIDKSLFNIPMYWHLLTIVGGFIKGKFYQFPESKEIACLFINEILANQNKEILGIGLLKILEDIYQSSGDIDGAIIFFNQLFPFLPQDTEEMLKRMAKEVFLFSGSYHTIPISKDVCVGFLNLNDKSLIEIEEAFSLEIKNKEEKEKKDFFIDNDPIIIVKEEIDKFINSFTQIPNEKNTKESIEKLIQLINFVPRRVGVDKFYEYFTKTQYTYLEVKSELDELKTKVHSPNFIRQLTEKEINRSIEIGKENLNVSLNIKFEQLNLDKMKIVAEIYRSIYCWIEALQNKFITLNLDQSMLSSFLEIKTDIEKQVNKIDLFKLGNIDEIVEYIPKYHDLVGELSVQKKYSIRIPGFIWKKRDKEIILLKAVIKAS